MMSLLARLDPGNAVTGLVFVVLVQISVVVLLAAVWPHLFRRRAEARQGLWLGALVLVFVSPVVAAVAADPASRSGSSRCRSLVPGRDRASGDERSSHEGSRADIARLITELLAGPVRPKATRPKPSRSCRSSGLVRGRVRQRPSIPRRQCPQGRADLALDGGVLVGLARIAAGLDAGGGALSVGIGLDPVRHGSTLERVRNALGVSVLPPVFTSAAIRAPVAIGLLRRALSCRRAWPSRWPRLATRRARSRMCPCSSPRRMGWPVARLAGAILWPHLLVHFASGQLTRAREEICDNHVIRCSDPRGYARTLLALTEQCWPLGTLRPGLGLLTARWTLADVSPGYSTPGEVP